MMDWDTVWWFLAVTASVSLPLIPTQISAPVVDPSIGLSLSAEVGPAISIDGSRAIGGLA